MYGREICGTLQAAGDPPVPMGVYEKISLRRHPQRHGIWAAFAASPSSCCPYGWFRHACEKEPVLEETYQYNRADAKGEASFVTDVFELGGGTSTVEVKTSSPVDKHWIYLNYALIINQDSGQAWTSAGSELLPGYDSDGSWSEGKRTDL